jgi:hypothetical protein
MPSAETLPMAEPTPAASQEPQPGLRCRGCGCGDLRVIPAGDTSEQRKPVQGLHPLRWLSSFARPAILPRGVA